ncbi:MAG: MATE family efflux transporter [Pseudomonadota bacterium]
MALALVALISFEAVDLFFIAQLGVVPLAAVSLTFPVIALLTGIGIGFEAGAASCVSRAVGRKNNSLSRRLTTDAVVMAGIVTLLLCLIGQRTIQPLFNLLGGAPELLPYFREYLSIWYWVEPIAIMLWTALASIRARGHAPLESKLIIAAAVINLILDPLLIFGLFGFPRLEVQGAAIASLIANGVVFGYALLHLKFRLNVFASPWADLKDILHSLKELATIGIPAIATNAIIPISNGIIVSLVAAYGVTATAAFGVAMRIEPLALIPYYALSAVSSPFAGQNIAAGKHMRLFEGQRVILRFCIGLGLVLALVIAIVAKPLAGLFSSEPDVLHIASMYLWFVAPSYGIYGVVMAINASFNGIGNPLPAVAISAARVIIVLLPIVFVAQKMFGLFGIFAAISIANLVVGIGAYLWYGRKIGYLQQKALMAS